MPLPGTQPTPIPTPVVFPYEPGSGAITVSISYPTNVLTAWDDTEKRIPIRTTPLISIRYNVLTLADAETPSLAGLLYTNPQNRWYVPRWPSARQPTAVSGPTLAPSTTYYYKVTAIGTGGESVGSNEQSITTGTSPNNANQVSWAAATGATSYRVYRGTAAGAENGYIAVGNVLALTDTGLALTAGTPPASGTQAAPVQSQLANSTPLMTYTIDTTNTDFAVGKKALVWQSSSVWDLMTVNSTANGSVVLSGAPSFTHLPYQVYVVPLLVGSLPEGYGHDRVGTATIFQVQFDCDTTGYPAPAGSTESTYKGKPVAMGILTTKLGATETWHQSSEKVGDDSGMFVWRAHSVGPVLMREIHAICSSKAEISSLRAFLANRRGRYAPAWIGSAQYDFQLNAGYPATATSIVIKGTNFWAFYNGTSRTHLTITPSEGVVLPITVTSVTGAGTGLLQLNLDQAIGAAVDAMAPVSFLSFARLAADSVDLEYFGTDVMVCRIPFIDLPRETPT